MPFCTEDCTALTWCFVLFHLERRGGETGATELRKAKGLGWENAKKALWEQAAISPTRSVGQQGEREGENLWEASIGEVQHHLGKGARQWQRQVFKKKEGRKGGKQLSAQHCVTVHAKETQGV